MQARENILLDNIVISAQALRLTRNFSRIIRKTSHEVSACKIQHGA